MAAIPIRYELFGPRQGDGLLVSAKVAGSTGAYHFLAAVTASCFRLDPLLNASVEQARVSVIWNPWSPGNGVEVLSFDYAENSIPHNPSQMAEFTGLPNVHAVPSTADVTKAFQAALDTPTQRWIGFRVKRDGVADAQLYAVWLECVFSV